MDFRPPSRKTLVIMLIIPLLLTSGCMQAGKSSSQKQTDKDAKPPQTEGVKQNLSAADVAYNCGDNFCSRLENNYNCPRDCPQVCGNSICDAGENALNCAKDCIVSCENKPCEFGFKSSGLSRTKERDQEVELLKDLGFRFVEFNVYWEDIEPEKGKFKLDELKGFVDELTRNNITPIILIKTGSLEWAVDGVNKKGEKCEERKDLVAPERDSSYAPRNISEYRRYVRALVGTLSGNVKYWLIENEPAGCTFFVGDKEDYFNMLKTAYEEIHSVCSDCKVGLSNFAFKGDRKREVAPEDVYLDDILLIGGINYFDFFSEHCNAGRGKAELEELGLNVKFCDLDTLRDDHLEEWWMGKEIIITESGELDEFEVERRIKRNLYSFFYGNASLVGTLQIDQLKKCDNCKKFDENPLDDVQQNWRFMIKLFDGIQSIEYLGVNDGPAEKQYEHFKITRRNKPAFHVLWKDRGSVTVNLPGSYRKLDPFEEPKTVSGNNLAVASYPTVLEEFPSLEVGQTPNQTTTTIKQPETSSDWQLIGPGSSAFSPSISIAGSDRYLVINCGGVRRSSDSGESWQFANNGFDYKGYGDNADDFQIITPHPSDSSVVFAGGKTGLYRSADRGASWSKVTSVGEVGVDAIAFDPSDNNIVYAGEGSLDANEPYFNVRDSEGTVLRSNDKGLTWQIVSHIRDNDKKSKENIYSLSVSRNGIVYAATNVGLWKSADDGKTWSKLSGLPHDHTVTVKTDRFSQKTVYTVLLANPESKGGVWKSTDEGTTWEDITSNLPALEWNFNDDSEKTKKSKTEEKEDETFGGKEFGKTRSYKDFELHPKEPNTIYVTSIYRSDGGVWVSESGGVSWRKLTTKDNVLEGWAENKLRELTAADLAINEENPLEMAFTSHGEAQGFRTVDGGKTWLPLQTKKVGVAGGRNTYANIGMESYKGAMAIQPNNSNIVLLAYGDHGIFKSVDGGKSFFRASDTASDALNLRFSPANPDKAYMVSWQPNKNLWVSNDAGSTWQSRNQEGQELMDVAPHPADENIAFVASYGYGLLRTTDGGKTWSTVGAFPAKDISSVAFYPSNPNVIFAGTDAILYTTSDGGTTWSNAYEFAEKTHINAILILKDFVYLATDNGVYVKSFGIEPSDWTLVLDLKEVVAIDGKDNYIYAASSGNGVWMSKQNGAKGTWQEITGDWSGDVRHLAVDSQNPNIVYASGKCAGVWRRVN